jgi:hypothetical protein
MVILSYKYYVDRKKVITNENGDLIEVSNDSSDGVYTRILEDIYT